MSSYGQKPYPRIISVEIYGASFNNCISYLRVFTGDMHIQKALTPIFTRLIFRVKFPNIEKEIHLYQKDFDGDWCEGTCS